MHVSGAMCMDGNLGNSIEADMFPERLIMECPHGAVKKKDWYFKTFHKSY